MKTIALSILATLLVPLLAWPAGPQDFVTKYCIACHGPDKQKADRRFDTLPSTITSLDHLERWQEVVDVLNLEEMPPEDEPSPSAAERAKIIATLTAFIAEGNERLADTGGHSVLRRINKWEYQHTVGDMLKMDVTLRNPAEDFPAEMDFKPDRFRYISDTGYTDMNGRHYRGGHLGFEPLALKGVPHSGMYKIRVKAAAVDRTHPYGKELDDVRNGDPIVLELAAVTREGSVTSEGSVTEYRSLELAELTDEKPKWLEWDVYLEKGFEPEVRFRNGTMATKRLVRLINKKVKGPEMDAINKIESKIHKNHALLKAYRGPKLRIWEIQVSGPHIEKDLWPPASHQALYGGVKAGKLNQTKIDDRLQAFAETAFRRPLKAGELAPVKAMVRGKIEAGLSPLDALKLGFQTILCSPGFIYLSEGEGALDDYALASRLSYFLWSSAPDRTLLDAAKKGNLADPNNLARHVDRMLADPKSNRFVENFIRLWLNVDSIGEMPISRDFRDYFRDNLEHAMSGETETFLRHLIDKNLPPAEFLTADYSFLNRELGIHYGMEGLEGNRFRKVSLAGTDRRGLTGHALFLTASANGVDTSPVVRGMYVSERILGYTPPPPPPDVPEIESDVGDAKSIRDVLEKHRSIASCAECHRKIDPLGFGLENYNAIGGYREKYPGKIAIDSSGKLHTGEAFQTPTEFRNLLAARSDDFTRCLAEKLLTYALGRELEFGDRAVIDQMTAQLKADRGGMRDLVKAVVVSKSFGKN